MTNWSFSSWKGAFLFLWVVSLPFFVSSQTKNQVDDQGRKQGYWEKKGENGKVKYKGQFQDGVPVGEFTYYDEKGILASKMEFVSADSARAIHYYSNGQISGKGLYVQQKKEGLWRFFDQKGVLASQQEYHIGMKNGEQIIYNLDGSVSRQTYFINDVENGYRKTYDNQGVLLTEGEIKDGNMDGMQIWYRNGVINIKGAYKHAVPDGEWIYYDAEGKPYTTEYYELGIKK